MRGATTRLQQVCRTARPRQMAPHAGAAARNAVRRRKVARCQRPPGLRHQLQLLRILHMKWSACITVSCFGVRSGVRT